MHLLALPLIFFINVRLAQSPLLFFLFLIIPVMPVPLSAQDHDSKRFYPGDVAAFNEMTAVPEYFGTVRLHEKFWMDDEIIGPRSHAPSWVKFENVEFGDGYDYLLTRYSVDSDLGRTVVEIRLGSPDTDGELIGDFRVENTGGWDRFVDRYIPLTQVSGEHDLYIVFEHSANYRFFELNNAIPDGFLRNQPADAYQEFVRPDLSLQDPVHHFDMPMPVSDILIDQAFLQLSSDGGGQFTRGRLGSNRGSRQAAAVLATAAAQGNQDPFIALKLLEVIRGGRTTILNSNGDVKYIGDTALPYTIAMVWNTPEIRSQLSRSEQHSLQLYMKGMMIDYAFKMAEFSPDGHPRSAQRFRLNGVPAWTGGNPNYYERHSTNFMYAASVIGWENVEDFLRNYDHLAFLEQLKESEHRGVSQDLYNHMNTTFMRIIGRTRYDASTPEKKARLVDSYIHGIFKFEEQGIPFFRGRWLSELLENPAILQYNNTLDRTFDKRALQGDYIGRRGMFHEFDTNDGGDEVMGASNYLRDDLSYSRYAIIQPVWYNLFLRYTGHWDQLDEEKRQLIADRMSVALSDLQPKASGYWSTNFRGSQFKILVDREAYIFGEQMAANMGHIRPRIFSENFEEALHVGINWRAFGNWTKEIVDTWTGRPQHRMDDIAPDHVIQSDPQGTHILVSAYQISDYNMYVQMVVNQWGEDQSGTGIIGRFADEDNYITMVYNSPERSLQIIRVRDGDHHVLAETPHELETGRMNYIRGKFSGENLALYVNSQRMVSAVDDAPVQGGVGLITHDSKAQFDNIMVTTDSYGDLGHHDMEYWLERQLAK